MDGNNINASSSSAAAEVEVGKNSSTLAMTGNDIGTSSQSQGQFPSFQKSKESRESKLGFDENCLLTKLNKDKGNTNDGKGDKNDERGNLVFANINGQLNPIFIPSIIFHIGSFLPCSDLKRCRLLNKQWNEECSKHLRTKGLVKLTSKASVLNFISQFKEQPNFCQNFHFELTKVIDRETERFFQRFGSIIKYFKLDFSSNGHQLSADGFYDLIFLKLPNLQELSLVGSVSDKDHFLPEGKRVAKSPTLGSSSPKTHVYPSLPKLKTLEIFLHNSTSGENVTKHEFLIELLSCVPYLEKISVPKVPRMLSFGMPLLHTLITKEHMQFKKLQHLDMDVALYNASINILKSKGYPLKYLNAEINSTVSEDSLHSLLETYEKTLTTLQLKFPRSPVASSELKLSNSFKVLKHLTLHGYRGSLNFLEHLDLQTFGLIDNSFTIAMRRPDFTYPLRAQFSYKMIWTEFTEESYCFEYLDSNDSQLLHKFSINFPNLRSLNLPHLNDFDLRIIYKNFPHSLQELTMENPLCSDYGLTGVGFGVLTRSRNKDEVEKCRTQPFVGDLKRLRKLEILTPSINVTDLSIKFGMVHCENLKILILHCASITDEGLREIVDSMYLEHLETTMCANIRASGVKYALDKMTKREMTFVWNKHQSRLTSCCINRFLNGNASVTCIVP